MCLPLSKIPENLLMRADSGLPAVANEIYKTMLNSKPGFKKKLRRTFR